MNYIIKQEEILGEVITWIIVKKDDGAERSFLAKNSSKPYISFLRQLSQENPEDPHYVAWVEAGNNPDDFWTQTEETI